MLRSSDGKRLSANAGKFSFACVLWVANDFCNEDIVWISECCAKSRKAVYTTLVRFLFFCSSNQGELLCMWLLDSAFCCDWASLIFSLLFPVSEHSRWLHLVRIEVRIWTLVACMLLRKVYIHTSFFVNTQNAVASLTPSLSCQPSMDCRWPIGIARYFKTTKAFSSLLRYQSCRQRVNFHFWTNL